MNIIDSCPNCDSFSIDLHEGQLSRFVYDRMLDLSKTTDIPISCKIFRCSNCNFTGTTVRFSEQEEKQYYRNYMKEEYINHRFLYENSKSHLEVFNTEDYKNVRRQMLNNILQKNIETKNVHAVLDYGGDTGELIPKCLSHAKKYLLEIEDRKVSDEIFRIKNPKDTNQIDLIIAAHIFEHVSSPQNLLKHILSFMHKNTYLYIEVPKENHEHHFHEHINQYNLSSLHVLLNKYGIEVIVGENFRYPRYINSAYYVLGKLK